MFLRQGYLVGSLVLISIFFASATCFATGVAVIFKDEQGAHLANSSVKVISANAERVGDDLRIKGRLEQWHRLPMAGHLHTYIYSESGQTLSDSKHRVHGLNSKRKGLRRTTFNVLLDGFPAETVKVFLEYHSPGHREG